MAMECSGYLLEKGLHLAASWETRLQGSAQGFSFCKFHWNKVGTKSGWEEFWDCKGQQMIIAEAKLYLRFIVGMGEGDETAHQGISRAGRSICITPRCVFQRSSDRSNH